MKGEDQIHATSLVQLWDLVAPSVLILCISMRKANYSGYILNIQNILVLLKTF